MLPPGSHLVFNETTVSISGHCCFCNKKWQLELEKIRWRNFLQGQDELEDLPEIRILLILSLCEECNEEGSENIASDCKSTS